MDKRVLHIPAGFRFGGSACGLKASGKPDLAIATADPGAAAVALFTTNRVVAAPIVVGRDHLRRARSIRAVIVNSGNANCATGTRGLRACAAVCSSVAKALDVRPQEVFPSSTGIIGVPLDGRKIVSSISGLVAATGTYAAHVGAFAEAILTTDTRPKIASARLRLRGRSVNILGIAKGAGMIHPQMATMLAYVFTDARLSDSQMRPLWRRAIGQTLNAISIDGDTSTNDTALLLANGASGIEPRSAAERSGFEQALADVCRDLAQAIVADGEGVHHVVEIRVSGAQRDADARRIAATIATSALVKTAIAGSDPNWGRLLAATGRAGVAFNASEVTIRIAGRLVCKGGAGLAFNKQQVSRLMEKRAYPIDITVGHGPGTANYLACDLSSEYVAINAEYST